MKSMDEPRRWSKPPWLSDLWSLWYGAKTLMRGFLIMDLISPELPRQILQLSSAKARWSSRILRLVSTDQWDTATSRVGLIGKERLDMQYLRPVRTAGAPSARALILLDDINDQPAKTPHFQNRRF
jgi:hypothetical protein